MCAVDHSGCKLAEASGITLQTDMDKQTAATMRGMMQQQRMAGSEWRERESEAR